MPRANADDKESARPSKGTRPKSVPTHVQWDEENIKATYHPPDKDYGFMTIDEPKTPYEPHQRGKDHSVNMDDLHEKLANLSKSAHDQRVRTKEEFEEMRRKHYAGMGKRAREEVDPIVEEYLRRAPSAAPISKRRSKLDKKKR